LIAKIFILIGVFIKLDSVITATDERPVM